MRARMVLGMVAISILLISLLISCQASSNTPEPSTDRVKVGYFPAAGRYAGFYAAIDKGFYNQENIEVKLVPIYGGEDRLSAIQGGKVDLILTDATETVLAQENGVDVKIIGIIQATNSLSTLSLKDTNIQTPRDYDGHIFGAKPGGLELKLLPVIGHLNNFQASEVKVKRLAYEALLPSLLNGSVDFVITFHDSGAYAAQKTANEAGKPLRLIRWSEYGLDTYGDSIVAQTELLADDPELVKRFLRASMRGFAYAAAHSNEVPDIVHEFAPTEEKDAIAVDWSRGLENLTDEATEKHGLGWIDEEKLTRTKAIALQAYSLKKQVPDDEVYTNEFLPGPDVNTSTK